MTMTATMGTKISRILFLSDPPLLLLLFITGEEEDDGVKEEGGKEEVDRNSVDNKLRV